MGSGIQEALGIVRGTLKDEKVRIVPYAPSRRKEKTRPQVDTNSAVRTEQGPTAVHNAGVTITEKKWDTVTRNAIGHFQALYSYSESEGCISSEGACSS